MLNFGRPTGQKRIFASQQERTPVLSRAWTLGHRVSSRRKHLGANMSETPSPGGLHADTAANQLVAENLALVGSVVTEVAT